MSKARETRRETPPRNVLTSSEVAGLLQVSRCRLRSLMKQNVLPPAWMAPQWYRGWCWTYEQIDEWLAWRCRFRQLPLRDSLVRTTALFPVRRLMTVRDVEKTVGADRISPLSGKSAIRRSCDGCVASRCRYCGSVGMCASIRER